MDILNFGGLGWPMAAACLPIFAALNRWWGSDHQITIGGKKQGKKAVILLASLVTGFAVGGLFGLCLGALFFADRTLDFFKSSGAPHNAGEILACVFKNALIVPLAAFAAQQFGQDVARTAYFYIAYAVVSVILAVVYGRADSEAKEDNEPIGNLNTFIEIARGAAQGLAVALTTGGLP